MAVLRGARAQTATPSSAGEPDGPGTPPHKPYDPKRKPDYENVRYGPYDRNILDIYQAKSEKPSPLLLYIHGGAFVGGDKNKLSAVLLDIANKAGITIAGIDYRYANKSPYPAQYEDSARALQFLRLHARDYHLNPHAVAATGDSAGAVVTLYLGFHPDMADPNSSDPLKRQSTRLSVVVPTAAQTTADPRTMEKIVGPEIWKQPNFATFYGLRPDEVHTEKAYKLYEAGSPDNYLTKDDPPVFIFFDVPNIPLTPDTPPPQRGHHPNYGFYLKKKMDALGIECVIRLKADYTDPNIPMQVQMNTELVNFCLSHFPKGS